MRGSWSLLLVLNGAFTVPAQAQSSRARAVPTIDSIAFVSRNVFDPDEAAKNIIFRFMNGFHIKTQQYIVRQELLFNRGRPFDSAAVAETERNLRALQLFRDVDIDSVRVGNQLVMRVDAADAWSTTIQSEFKSTGGQTEWGIGLRERNLLGTATLVRVKYRNKVDRTELTTEAQQDRLFGTRVGFWLRYDFLSDGNFGRWTFGRPFRSFSDKLGIEFEGEQAQRRELQFRNGEIFQEMWHREFRQDVKAAFALRSGEDGFLRLGLLGQLKREEFLAIADTGLAIPDTVRGSVGVFLEFASSRFKVTHYYLAFKRDVDVDLSTRFTVGARLAPSAFGYDKTGIGPAVDFQVAAPLGNGFIKLEAHANGLFNSGGLDSGQVNGALTGMIQILPKSATVIRVEAGAQDDVPPSQEIDLGLGIGPRAFKAHAFTGTRSLWGTAEQRFFLVDEFMGLFGLGFAGFLDYGGAWFPDQPVRAGGDVGVGLRMSSTRAGGVTMGRLDLSYRFGDGFEDKRWAVSFGRAVAF